MELIRITSHDQFEQYRNDWSFILEENENTNPFIEFDWINEWWRHLGRNKQVEIIGIRKDEKCIAFFPFFMKKVC